jgi:hypothetical protein
VEQEAALTARKMCKIKARFLPVEGTRKAYGMQDKNMYKFAETGFMIGIAGSSKVVTSLEKVGRAIDVQPGNRNWVTAMECISAFGWCLPSFLNLEGKLY